jgi:hypothetical protein
VQLSTVGMVWGLVRCTTSLPSFALLSQPGYHQPPGDSTQTTAQMLAPYRARWSPQVLAGLIAAGPSTFPRVDHKHFDIHTSTGRAAGCTREDFGSKGARVVHELPHYQPLRLAYIQVRTSVLKCGQ